MMEIIEKKKWSESDDRNHRKKRNIKWGSESDDGNHKGDKMDYDGVKVMMGIIEKTKWMREWKWWWKSQRE